MTPGTRHRLTMILASLCLEAKAGSYAEFLKFIGDQKVKNPDTGRTVKYKSLKGPKGQELLAREYEKWKTTSGKGGTNDTEPESAETKTSTPFKPIPLDSWRERDAYAAKWDKVREKWPAQERKAVLEYTGGTYKDINRGLRSGDVDPESKEAVALMDKLFQSSKGKTKDPVTVYRIVAEDHPLVILLKDNKLKEGYTYSDPGYMSTSIAPDAFKAPHPYKFHIDVPKGSQGIYVGNPPRGAYSYYGDELELILNRGTKVEITKIEGKKIHCKVVNS